MSENLDNTLNAIDQELSKLMNLTTVVSSFDTVKSANKAYEDQIAALTKSLDVQRTHNWATYETPEAPSNYLTQQQELAALKEKTDVENYKAPLTTGQRVKEAYGTAKSNLSEGYNTAMGYGKQLRGLPSKALGWGKDKLGIGGGAGGAAGGMAGMGGMMSMMAPMMAAAAVMKLFAEPLQMIMEPIEMLTDIFGSTLLPAVQPLADVLYSMAPTVEIIAKQFGEQLAPIMAQLAPIVAQLMPPIMNLVMVMMTALYPVFSMVLTAINPLIPIFASLITFITPIALIVTQLIAPIAMLLSPLGLIVGIFTALGVAAGFFMDQVKGISDFFNNAGAAISNWWEQLW